jgi:DNA-binding NarL/FixJ family response regulator
LYREGLKAIVLTDSRYRVVGLARTAGEASKLSRKLQPDLALVDLALPDSEGSDLIRTLHREFSRLRIIAVCRDLRSKSVAAAMRAGAKAVLSRDSKDGTLLGCLAAVSAGKPFFDETFSTEEAGRGVSGLRARAIALTAREIEILVGVSKGKSKKEIAKKLSLSLKTVENYYSRLLRKVGLDTAVAALRYAVQIGLVDPDEWSRPK